jgi:hypothetical protein
MTRIPWTPRIRLILSIVLYGIFALDSFSHRDSVRLPFPVYFLGMSAVCYLFFYITEHSSSKGETILGVIGSHYSSYPGGDRGSFIHFWLGAFRSA